MSTTTQFCISRSSPCIPYNFQHVCCRYPSSVPYSSNYTYPPPRMMRDPFQAAPPNYNQQHQGLYSRLPTLCVGHYSSVLTVVIYSLSPIILLTVCLQVVLDSAWMPTTDFRIVSLAIRPLGLRRWVSSTGDPDRQVILHLRPLIIAALVYTHSTDRPITLITGMCRWLYH